ncbi:protoporphyrinogen oxidase [Streptomyces lycii]|uniref:Coproporphyrinogen III oxidase n=1 Tax=Streptomyces lycii TaxID=2654337 RepID=A0ABQ7FPJ1_9ACTN|nr:protoporphyrinogen oxidase [Streptomyces lycii]KAF4410285.1 protoporphyrinogen oxidase [Streptomyces lycii]
MRETDARPGHVVVVGGGVAGLAAAHRLLGGGARVTVLEGSGRLGGKLLAGEIAGVPVDLGAESMLARRPEAVELARAAGLGERLQPPATASAALWTRGRLRPMPKGHVMGVPGDLAPLAESGVISPEGLARIERDRELPRTEVGEDVAVGGYIAARLGREVVDRLVEPLLGGVYAGNAYAISMRAAVPQLYEAARAERSLTEGVRAIQRRTARQPAAGGPVFMGIDGGVGTLPPALAGVCRAAGAEIATGVTVTGLRRTAHGWRLELTGPGAERAAGTAAARAEADAGKTAGSGRTDATGRTDRDGTAEGTGKAGEAGRSGASGAGAAARAAEAAGGAASPGAGRAVLHADGVVLAVPAPAAARLLADASPAASAELAAVEYASMALVTMAFRRADLASLPEGSGFLVPPVDGRTIKAATFASRKWGWIRDADPDLFVLRTSVGRFGDEADLKRDDADLVELSLRDLGEAAGLAARPVASRVTRWDGGLPQYPVGHLGRVARIREHLAGLPALSVCGAAYDGVGIPACAAGATAAAESVLATLAPGTADGGGEWAS